MSLSCYHLSPPFAALLSASKRQRPQGSPAGNIGSQEKADPTVIGDVVNLASRLEALTRMYPVHILIGASASKLIRDEFHLRSVALVQVKGKTRPVELFTLIGVKNDPGDQQRLQRLELYEAGLRKSRERDFRQAKTLFSTFSSSIRKMHSRRCILNARLHMKRSRQTNPGTRSKSFRKSEVFPGTRNPCVVRKSAILSWLIQWIVQLTPSPPRSFTGYAGDTG
jgi:hypothetical protein